LFEGKKKSCRNWPFLKILKIGQIKKIKKKLKKIIYQLGAE
jgi:hypothetical protein